MPKSRIYVFESGQPDASRWLSLGAKPGGEALMILTDLCHPGRLSSLRSVACSLDLLRDALAAGSLQITLADGYFLARRVGDLILVEFRGEGDANPSKVELRAEDVVRRIDELCLAAV